MNTTASCTIQLKFSWTVFSQSTLVVLFVFSDSFCQHELTLILAWINNYIHYKVWDSMTYPFPSLINAAIEERYVNRDLGQHWLRKWLVAWRHQAITWTNIDLSSVSSQGINLRTLSLENLNKPIRKTRFIIVSLKSHPDITGTTELTNS